MAPVNKYVRCLILHYVRRDDYSKYTKYLRYKETYVSGTHSISKKWFRFVTFSEFSYCVTNSSAQRAWQKTQRPSFAAEPQKQTGRRQKIERAQRSKTSAADCSCSHQCSRGEEQVKSACSYAVTATGKKDRVRAAPQLPTPYAAQ